MLNPPDRWIWDFWHVHDDATHHLFYLQAPKSLGDPELRHRNATIGHATSTDLRTWTEHGTVLDPEDSSAAGATATWTGCVVRTSDGGWRMFYTGANFPSPHENSNVETILAADSDDLYSWRSDPTFALRAEPRWYETLGTSSWPEEAWRDPWVHQGSDGQWHMLITARASGGAVDNRGVVGSAISRDLFTWTAEEPLTQSDAGFAQLEVLQRVTLGTRDFIVFSAHRLMLTKQCRSRGGDTGTWMAPIDDGIRLDAAVNITGPSLYSGRIIDHRDQPYLLAFRTVDDDGEFLGGIIDPVPLTLDEESSTPRLAQQIGARP